MSLCHDLQRLSKEQICTAQASSAGKSSLTFAILRMNHVAHSIVSCVNQDYRQLDPLTHGSKLVGGLLVAIWHHGTALPGKDEVRDVQRCTRQSNQLRKSLNHFQINCLVMNFRITLILNQRILTIKTMRILIVTIQTMRILMMMKSSTSVVCTSEQVYVTNCTSFYGSKTSCLFTMYCAAKHLTF